MRDIFPPPETQVLPLLRLLLKLLLSISSTISQFYYHKIRHNAEKGSVHTVYASEIFGVHKTKLGVHVYAVYANCRALVVALQLSWHCGATRRNDTLRGGSVVSSRGTAVARQVVLVSSLIFFG